ncbi:MAG: MFS transporter [Spirochaetales bacterium]|nr:MFS transporter [Spirochaetales bacterium]
MDSWKRNLYVTWAAQIISIAGFGFVLPFLPYFVQEVGVTDAAELNRWVGLINSIASVGMGLMGPVWGIIADRYGRKLMIVRAMLSGTALLFAMSYAQSVQGIFILRMLQGIFCGTVTASATLIAAGTPKARLSFALGFLSSSTFIGFSLGPLLGGVAAEYLGYRMAFRIGAVLQAAGLAFVLFVVREVRHQETEPATAKNGKPRETIDIRVVALLLGLFFLLRYARMMMPPFVPLHVQSILGTIRGASATVGVISSLTGLAAALAGITIVRLGDKMDKLRLISICLFASVLLTLPIFFTGSLYGFTVFYVMAAFSTGSVEPIMQSYFSERTPANRRGRLFGLQTLVGSMGWFAAPLTSSFISNSLSISHVFLFTSVFFAVTFLYSLAARWGIRHVPGAAYARTTSGSGGAD